MTAVMTQLAPASDQGWRCDLCNKSFLRKEHLIRHNRVHADTNRHECPICERVLHRSDHFQFHLQSHANKAKPFECTQCHRRYSHLYSLKRHQTNTSHTGILQHQVEIDVEQLRHDYEQRQQTPPKRKKRIKSPPTSTAEPSAKRTPQAPEPTAITSTATAGHQPIGGQIPFSGPLLAALMCQQSQMAMAQPTSALKSCLTAGLPLVSMAPITTMAASTAFSGLLPQQAPLNLLQQLYPGLNALVAAQRLGMLAAATSVATSLGGMSGLHTTLPSSATPVNVLAQLHLRGPTSMTMSSSS
eukprot:m.73618 g.73618  ORF g.73618 m.73618 type:complete len:300 (-) comp14337_c0_seq6:1134-2033(-)